MTISEKLVITIIIEILIIILVIFEEKSDK